MVELQLFAGTISSAPVDHRRALWVLGNGNMGGVGRHALDVVRSGIPGWELAFLVPPGQLATELRRAGATLLPDEGGKFNKSAGALSGVRAVRQALVALRPAIVHSHLSWADVVTAAANLGIGIPIVSTEHGIADIPGLYNRSPWKAAGKRLLHRARLTRTAGLICVSHATARSVDAQWGSARLPLRTVIHNGIDSPAGLPHRIGGRIGVLSRLAPEKRIDLVVRAFADVHRDWPDSTLIIAGSGREENNLRALVAHSGLEKFVTFPGYLPSEEFWPQVDIVVQLSWWENCSYTLLDAVAQGRGVAASDVGGNAEFLPPGALVAADPAVSSVADVILHQRNQSYSLPDKWPDRTAMTSSIAAFYERVLSGTADKFGRFQSEADAGAGPVSPTPAAQPPLSSP